MRPTTERTLWQELALEFTVLGHHFGVDGRAFRERAEALRTSWEEVAQRIPNPLLVWKHLTYCLAKALVPQRGGEWVARHLVPEAQALYALAMEGGFEVVEARRALVRGRFLPGFVPSAALAWQALEAGVDLDPAERNLEAFLDLVRGSKEDRGPFLAHRGGPPAQTLVDLILDGGVPEGVLPEVSEVVEVEVASPESSGTLGLDHLQEGVAPEGPVVLLLRQGERLLPYLLVGELLLAYPTRKK